MSICFEIMAESHGKEVMEIFNYYVENSLAAFPENKLPVEAYGMFLKMTQGYPAYVLRETAEISYFLKPDSAKKGIGTQALRKLEEEAIKKGIRKILACISSENIASIKFHQKNGFTECGCFHHAGKKHGRYFDLVWMEKDIAQ
jgi:phosphinothricin acetyltransferase